jgi:hypothetical protein
MPRNRIARQRIEANSVDIAFNMSTFDACSTVSSARGLMHSAAAAVYEPA